MSMLLAVATNVVASPTPQVVKEVLQPVVQPVAQTPAAVLQLAQILALAGAGVVTGLVHQLVERGRWSGNTNRLVLTAYSTAAALVVAYLTGELKLDANGVTTMLTAFLAVFASATGRLELFRFVSNLLASKPEIAGLAVEEPEAVV